MRLAFKLLLLTYAIELSTMEEFQDSNSERPTINTDEEIEESYKPLHHNTTELIRRIKACGEKYPDMYNETLNILIEKIKQANVSLLRDNVTDLLSDWLKDKVEVNFYQGILAVYPQRVASFGCWFSTSGDRLQMSIFGKNFVIKGKKKGGRRRRRDTLLENTVLESNTKAPGKSHIYLGLSLYPLLTEESRIIDKYHTLPPPVAPGRPDIHVKRKPVLDDVSGIKVIKEETELLSEL